MIRSLLPVLALAAPMAAPLTAADVWQVDAGHSTALFAAQHFGAGFTWGRFNKLSGSVSTDADATKNSVSISIDAASIDSGNADRDKHLASPDFLNAKQFPTLTFASTAWTPKTDTTAEVAGTLTIKGVSKPVTVTVTRTGVGENPMAKKAAVGFETTFTIKRADFGITYGQGSVGEDIRITLAIEALKQ